MKRTPRTAFVAAFLASIAIPMAPAQSEAADPPEAGGEEAPDGEETGGEPGPNAPGAPGISRFDLDTMVVTPSQRSESILDAPYTVYSVPEQRILELRTFPQALRDIPGVMVQETGPAQGSPFIRGFTGFRTLLLVDGIRLNNSSFREGPNQYAGTIDALGLDRIEVLKGPNSVHYGSDAIGGTMNAFSRDPFVLDRAIGGRFTTRAATDANYNVQRLDLSGATDTGTLWRIGGSKKDFGDQQAGDGINLPETGYDEWDADAKVIHPIDEFTSLTFAFQAVDIDDAPRTHRTVFAVPFAGSDVGGDLQRNFDQQRTLAYLRLNQTAAYSGDWSTETTVSYQEHDETRSRVRTGGRFEDRGFDLNTLGFAMRGRRDTSLGRLTVGGEWYRDSVDSFTDRFADQTPADDIQGPIADDATYDLGGLYADLAMDVGASTTVTAGARFTYAAANADSVRDPVTMARTTLEDDFTALVGSLRFESRVVETDDAVVALFGGVSQGFRAPTLSDLTRFDSARSGEFETPAPGLDPEEFISFEFGFKHETERLSMQLAAFLTEGDDIIQRVLTGQVVDGENEVTKLNVGSSTIGGVEFAASYAIDDNISAFGNLAWLDGQEETVDTVGDPVIEAAPSRLQPLTFMAGVRIDPQYAPWQAELRWIHAEDADRLAPRDITDTTRIPPGGTPGYDVIDLITRWDLGEGSNLMVGIENLTDENYRVHGSGLNRPGRNVVFGLTFNF